MNIVARKEIKKITLAALFMVLSLILSRASVYVPIFGAPLMRFGLGTIPIVLGSLLLGPLYGAVIGGLADLIGALAFPVGPYFFGFTLDSMLLGVMPWLVLFIAKKIKHGSQLTASFVYLFVVSLLVAFLIKFNSVKIFDHVIVLNVYLKAALGVLYSLALLAIYYFTHRKATEENSSFRIVFNSVLVNEIFITALLAGLWKYLLYGVPYFVNVGISTLLLLINLPIKSLIIFGIYRSILPVFNNQFSDVNRLD